MFQMLCFGLIILIWRGNSLSMISTRSYDQVILFWLFYEHLQGCKSWGGSGGPWTPNVRYSLGPAMPSKSTACRPRGELSILVINRLDLPCGWPTPGGC